MASVGVEKYSLAIQFIFSSLDNLENPANSVIHSQLIIGIIGCKDTF